MCSEIEAKLKIESPEQIESRLVELGAEFVAEQLQTDCHFDDDNAAMSKADKALRLRRQSVGETTQFLLTYKGPKEQSNFKKRREIVHIPKPCQTSEMEHPSAAGQVSSFSTIFIDWQYH